MSGSVAAVSIVLVGFAYGTGWRERVNEPQPSMQICQRKLAALKKDWDLRLPAEARINLGCAKQGPDGLTQEERWGRNCLRWGKCFQGAPDAIITIEGPVKTKEVE